MKAKIETVYKNVMAGFRCGDCGQPMSEFYPAKGQGIFFSCLKCHKQFSIYRVEA